MLWGFFVPLCWGLYHCQWVEFLSRLFYLLKTLPSSLPPHPVPPDPSSLQQFSSYLMSIWNYVIYVIDIYQHWYTYTCVCVFVSLLSVSPTITQAPRGQGLCLNHYVFSVPRTVSTFTRSSIFVKWITVLAQTPPLLDKNDPSPSSETL